MYVITSDAAKVEIVGINPPLEASNTWREVRVDHLSQAKKYLFYMAIPLKKCLAACLVITLG
jgi:hypothetical protein